MKKKILKKHEIQGDLTFKSLDQIAARFSMEEKGQMGSRNIEFPADLIPEEFDPTIHEITGSFSVEFKVKEK